MNQKTFKKPIAQRKALLGYAVSDNQIPTYSLAQDQQFINPFEENTLINDAAHGMSARPKKKKKKKNKTKSKMKKS